MGLIVVPSVSDGVLNPPSQRGATPEALSRMRGMGVQNERRPMSKMSDLSVSGASRDCGKAVVCPKCRLGGLIYL